MGMALIAAGALASSPSLHAQTIHGRLLDIDTGLPIDLGLVIMLTESGDSITSALTTQNGYFSLTSPMPGTFLLLGSAWGYRETGDGVFELGEGAELTVEFRIRIFVETRSFDEKRGKLQRLARLSRTYIENPGSRRVAWTSGLAARRGVGTRWRRDQVEAPSAAAPVTGLTWARWMRALLQWIGWSRNKRGVLLSRQHPRLANGKITG